jgi:DNA helicase II / ATP-dependent DNA helicase PcrA
MELAKVIKGQAFMGAFSKSIADEFVARLAAQRSYHVKGSTVHSAGLAALKKIYPNSEIDKNKVKAIARQLYGWDTKAVNAIDSGVEFMKQACLGVNNDSEPDGGISQSSVQMIVDYYDLQDEIPAYMSVETYIKKCIEVYKRSLDECSKSIDFNDMILAPLYFDAPFKKYDWVMIDEAQDTSYARRLILYSMMRDDTRLVATGDKFQSIFQFSGASSDSMDLIKDYVHAQELPLSVTYRCPKAVVRLAQTWVPGITAHESAPEGVVRIETIDDFWKEKLTPRDVVLCRNNRPLMGVAQRLRDNGIPCIVQGRGGKGLVTLAVKWGEDLGIVAVVDKLQAYKDREAGKWEAKGDQERAESVRDRVDSLLDVAKKMGGNKKAKDLASRMEFLLGLGRDAPSNVLKLSSCHSSKGKEWQRVFLLGRNRYMPSKWAKKDWEMQSEQNLQYVSVTRSKSEFSDVMIPDDAQYNWWGDE